MSFIRILLSLVFLLGGVALVPKSAWACETPEKTAADFKAAYPQGKVFTFEEALAQRFLEAFNASPPKTAIAGDVVQLTIGPFARGVTHLHIYQDGCISQRGRISRRLIDTLMEMFDKGGRDI